MITTSNKFKEKIKNDVRELDAYVELLTNYKALGIGNTSLFNTRQVTTNNSAEITNIDTLVDESSLYNNYASFEKDYTLLDGSFILANRNYTNENTGFIGESNQATISITGIREQVRNITLYFTDEYPTNIEIILTTEFMQNDTPYDIIYNTYTINYDNNTSNTITTNENVIPEHIEQNSDTYLFYGITSITININEWSNVDHRVRIKQINAGETVLYENLDIIEMNIHEQTNFDNLEVPINSFNIILNNYDKKINILEEGNIIHRINENSSFLPYIGVLVDGVYEYVSMGKYLYSSYSDNRDKTASFDCYGDAKRMENQDIILPEWGLPSSQYLKTPTEITLNPSFLTDTVRYNNSFVGRLANFRSYKEQLQAVGIYAGSFIKQHRISQYLGSYYPITYEVLTDNYIDEVRLRRQLTIPTIKKKNKAKQIIVNSIMDGAISGNTITLVDDDFKTYRPNEITNANQIKVYIETTTPIDITSVKLYVDNVETTISYRGPAYLLMSNFNPYLKINEITEGTHHIMVTATEKNAIQRQYKVNNNIDAGEIIEYNNNFLNNNEQAKRVANYKFIYDRDYEFETEIMGDPTLEVGDTLKLETEAGYQLATIENLEIKYNGGLTEVVKGVSKSVL